MTNENAEIFEKRLALGIAGLNVLLLLLAAGLLVAVSGQLGVTPETIFNAIFVIITVLVYSAVAVLIISRYPRHTVGWLFLIVGFFQGSNGLGNVIENSQQVLAHSEFASDLFAWFGEFLVVQLAWLPAQFIPITLVLQFFPDGRLPSRRWWPVPVATLMVFVGWGITETSTSPGVARFFELITPIMAFLAAFSILGSLFGVVFRFRRSSGVERLQMKWLVYTALTGILTSLAFIISGVEGLVFDIIFLSLPTLLAITIGIAVLRYHLWDIDVLIRRTLQYTLLTGLLALVYFGSVVVLQSLVENLTGSQSPVVIVISTLAIAALFNPLRIRVQDFIDRRFFRKKYDAEQALAQFAAVSRDEVDMQKLTDALLDVVEETLQPEQASLWLKINR
jgi:hypothetical protein